MSRLLQEEDAKREALTNPWTKKAELALDRGDHLASDGGQFQDAGGGAALLSRMAAQADGANQAEQATQAEQTGETGPGKKPVGGVNKDPRFDPAKVRQTWIDHDIDPDKANNIVNKSMFGHNIAINAVVVPLVDKTNSLYGGLDAAKQQQVKQSVLSIGGYAKRTTNSGGFSLHSIGSSVDINPNMELKQNHEWNNLDDPLLGLYQDVVRSIPAMAEFDVSYDTGEKQLDASEAFNRRFPAYVRELIAQANGAPAPLPAADTQPQSADQKAAPVGTVGVHAAGPLPSLAEINAAIAAASRQNPDVASQLQLIKSKWRELNAWLYGARLGKGKLVGMVAQDRTLVQTMLQAGWAWGGDWSSKKDFMHFEDPTAEEKLQLGGDTKSSTPAKKSQAAALEADAAQRNQKSDQKSEKSGDDDTHDRD